MIGQVRVGGLKRDSAALVKIPKSVVAECLRPRRTTVRTSNTCFVVMAVNTTLIPTAEERIRDTKVLQSSDGIPGECTYNRLTVDSKFVLCQAIRIGIVSERI